MGRGVYTTTLYQSGLVLPIWDVFTWILTAHECLCLPVLPLSLPHEFDSEPASRGLLCNRAHLALQQLGLILLKALGLIPAHLYQGLVSWALFLLQAPLLVPK